MKFSTIVATRNCARALRRCLDYIAALAKKPLAQVFLLTFILAIAACGIARASVPSNFVPNANWWRGGATLDLDFYYDRYYLNGTSYSGVNNFIAGTGATFTRAGTNVTDTGAPFYLASNQNWSSRAVSTATYLATGSPFYLSGSQAFSSRASVTNNVTSTFAPFYTGASQSFVSRAGAVATYFDSTGTLQTAAANVARNATYSYNGSSWVANSGTLIEPAATNSIRNNSMTGAVASSATELTTNGNFATSCTSTCTGWTKVTPGTATVTFNSDAVLTGDGVSNAAAIHTTSAITTVANTIYTVAITVSGSGTPTLQVGTTSGSSNLLAATSISASGTTTLQFAASGTSSWIQINNLSASAATVTNVSVTSAGKPPTNWAFLLGSSQLITVVGTGTENGISYVDISFSGSGSSPFAINFDASTTLAALQGQTWTFSPDISQRPRFRRGKTL